MSLHESPEKRLSDLLRGEEFSAQVRSALGKAEDFPASEVRGLVERLPALVTERLLQSRESEPTLVDLLPQIGAQEPPARPVELMLAPDLPATVALHVMDEEPATVALVPTEGGDCYVSRSALRQATAKSGNAFRRKLEEALAAECGSLASRESIRTLTKETWSAASRALVGQGIRYRCLGDPSHRFTGKPGCEWCCKGDQHSGHTRARVERI